MRRRLRSTTTRAIGAGERPEERVVLSSSVCVHENTMVSCSHSELPTYTF